MKIALVYNKQKPLVDEVVSKIKSWASFENHTINSLPKLDRSVEFVIALGGDGTMLRAVRETGELEIPVMGINLGGLGFLTAFQSSDIDQALSDLSKKKGQD